MKAKQFDKDIQPDHSAEEQVNRHKGAATQSRLSDLNDFYALLGALAERSGLRVLSDCSGRMPWPQRGVYFFFENGEGRRVVRVGTHALTGTSKSTLWNRLSQHRGTAKNGGGNHRGSIFRLLVGSALIKRHGHNAENWGLGSNAPSAVKVGEQALEHEVSKVIGAMKVLWLEIERFPGEPEARGFVERNSIALLSNFEREPVDPPSADWLGYHCNRERVRRSGLWNQNHVDERHDADFLSRFEKLVSNQETVS